MSIYDYYLHAATSYDSTLQILNFQVVTASIYPREPHHTQDGHIKRFLNKRQDSPVAFYSTKY